MITGYLVDLTLGWKQSPVAEVRESESFGFHLNRNKCEVISNSETSPKLNNLKNFKLDKPEAASLLGVPLSDS